MKMRSGAHPAALLALASVFLASGHAGSTLVPPSRVSLHLRGAAPARGRQSGTGGSAPADPGSLRHRPPPRHGQSILGAMRGGGSGAAGTGTKIMQLSEQAEREGFDISAALARGGVGKKSGVHVRSQAEEDKAQQDMLKLCQAAMDTCFDGSIGPIADRLRNLIAEGEEPEEGGDYVPLKNFSVVAGRMHQVCLEGIEGTVDALTAELEAVHFTSMGGGGAVSCVDFDKLPVDKTHVPHLSGETKRELTASLDKTLESLWVQHKYAVTQSYFDRWERKFNARIAGSSKWEKWVRQTVSKCLKECERDLKRSTPKCKEGIWNATSEVLELRSAVNQSVVNAKGSGALLEWFATSGNPKVFSKRWFKRMFVKSVATYCQMVQGSWAVRKARGIGYPPRFSKAWFSALLLPWRADSGKPYPTQEQQQEQQQQQGQGGVSGADDAGAAGGDEEGVMGGEVGGDGGGVTTPPLSGKAASGVPPEMHQASDHRRVPTDGMAGAGGTDQNQGVRAGEEASDSKKGLGIEGLLAGLGKGIGEVAERMGHNVGGSARDAIGEALGGFARAMPWHKEGGDGGIHAPAVAHVGVAPPLQGDDEGETQPQMVRGLGGRAFIPDREEINKHPKLT